MGTGFGAGITWSAVLSMERCNVNELNFKRGVCAWWRSATLWLSPPAYPSDCSAAVSHARGTVIAYSALSWLSRQCMTLGECQLNV